jgi:magnesium chelatase family protein
VGRLAEAVGVLAGQLGREPVEPGIEELFGKLNRYEVDFIDVRG